MIIFDSCRLKWLVKRQQWNCLRTTVSNCLFPFMFIEFNQWKIWIYSMVVTLNFMAERKVIHIHRLRSIPFVWPFGRQTGYGKILPSHSKILSVILRWPICEKASVMISLLPFYLCAHRIYRSVRGAHACNDAASSMPIFACFRLPAHVRRVPNAREIPSFFMQTKTARIYERLVCSRRLPCGIRKRDAAFQ